METRPTIKQALACVRAAKEQLGQARATVRDRRLTDDAYWEAMADLGDTHRQLQRARYAYRQAVGF